MSEGKIFLAHCATEEMMENRKVKVDAVIPVYRPGKEFHELLEGLANQSHKLNKIILMNTGEAPWKEEIEKQYPNCEIHLLKKEEFDHGGTRHEGTTYSDADYLLFLTQDAMPKRLMEDSCQILNAVKLKNIQEALIIRKNLRLNQKQIFQRLESRRSSARMYVPCMKKLLMKNRADLSDEQFLMKI